MSSVLLFSGGMDSFIGAWLLRPDICLYVDIGLPEQRAELMAATKLALPDGCRLVVDSRLRLADQKLPNEIVPMRNAFFAMIGAYYGDRVMLASIAGDSTPDKDEVFAAAVNHLLSHIFSVPDKNPPHLQTAPFRFEVPLRQQTKVEIVGQFLLQGLPAAWLRSSRSCYGAGELECGTCRSCVRKYVALALNGIACHNWFTSDPRLQLKEALEYAKRRKRGQEEQDIERALRENCG